VITAVAFDFAGVIGLDPLAGLRDYASELGLPDDSLTCFMRGDPEVARLEVGEISAREFLKYVCVEAEARHGIRLDIRRVATAVEWGQQLNPPMLDLVTEVHDRCTTALVTNNVREALDWRGNLPGHLFDHIVDSSAVGVRKPSTAIYEELLRLLDRPAEEVVFFDDFEENLPPATALGITAVHFTGVDDCRKTLTELGVL
jgi:putative hydrolase of the HAD superfamily